MQTETYQHEKTSNQEANLGAAKDYQFQDNFNGKKLVEFIEMGLEVKTTMVAALLGVSERTLGNWSKIDFGDPSAPPRFERLRCLYRVICALDQLSLDNRIYITILNESIPTHGEKSILDFIVQEPKNPLILTVALQIAKEFQ